MPHYLNHNKNLPISGNWGILSTLQVNYFQSQHNLRNQKKAYFTVEGDYFTS